MKKIIKLSLGLALAAALVSCESKLNPTPSAKPAYCASQIVMTMDAKFESLLYTDATGASCLPLIKGETVQFGYDMTPDNVTFPTVIWSSSDAACASVSDSGLVAALSGSGSGYSIIQAAPIGMHPGSGVNAAVKIVVSDALVPANAITLSAPALEVYGGETLQLSASIAPEAATYKTVAWTSSNPAVATVDSKGLVTAQITSAISTPVTITATALDGSKVSGFLEIAVKQIIVPTEISIDQKHTKSVYACAINEHTLTLDFTTVPAESTLSQISWTSSDEAIATVEGGIVRYNSSGKFGDFTITASLPNGKSASIDLSLAAGLIRELFDDSDYTWYNAKQSGNGTESSHIWHEDGQYLTVTTYKQNATASRGDFRCWEPKTYVHAGNYPIIAIRWEDVRDKYDFITAANINLDSSGDCEGVKFSGNLGGSNNKYAQKIKLDDGSCVLVYDLSTQNFPNGGTLPANSLATFTTFQFKYADMKTTDVQLEYNVYWVQSFKSIDDLKAFVAAEGRTIID